METYQNLSCPISPDKVNENTARINAILTAGLIGTSLFINSPVLSLLVTLDFFLRAFTSGDFSPGRALSKHIGMFLKLDEKLIDASPKRFAGGVGFTLSLLVSIFQLGGAGIFAISAGGILIFFALLEGVLGFCMGCLIYSLIVLPLWPKKWL